MAAIQSRSVALISLYKTLRKMHLRPVKRMRFQFDPFNEDSISLRNFLYHCSAKRIRRTSDICIIRTDIVNDRTEPILKVNLIDNECEIVFKTAKLSTLEIAQEFHKIVERFDVPEVAPSSPLLAKKSGFMKSFK